ncbi:predicted protein [Uncinocarpus reesii 1704]|uniref:Uncharacterized protein n=1 Tax=Uncinocarpus reesii (strain UAMH 1704) TaxID=336963 RepID=C4JZN0_UNCRE|nr:uncharacterized protein UREG_07631 [Uncinocarpus reesii 1704]EEP82766.1 predicted protein [Uncinocarpus reesii 1704]
MGHHDLAVMQRDRVVEWLLQVNPSDGTPIESGVPMGGGHITEYQGNCSSAVPGDANTIPCGQRGIGGPIEFMELPRKSDLKHPTYLNPGVTQPNPTRMPFSNIDNDAQPATSALYEKQPRRKTRKDRYDPKEASRNRDQSKVARNENKKFRNTKRVKRKHGKRLLEDQFVAPNVSQKRLTLSSNFDVGMFARGRASSPLSYKVPDLTFSEMKFLSHTAKQNQTITPTDVNKDRAVNRPPILEISEYFARPQLPKEPAKSCASSTSRSKVNPQKSMEESISINQPPNNAVIAPLDSSPRLQVAHRHSGKRTSRSTTYYSWSESNSDENSGFENRAGGNAPHPPPPHKPVPMKSENQAQLQRLVDDFEYDPLAISKAYDMVFKNAYLGQACESTASSKVVYSLEDLKELANQLFASTPGLRQWATCPLDGVEQQYGSTSHCGSMRENACSAYIEPATQQSQSWKLELPYLEDKSKARSQPQVSERIEQEHHLLNGYFENRPSHAHGIDRKYLPGNVESILGGPEAPSPLSTGTTRNLTNPFTFTRSRLEGTTTRESLYQMNFQEPGKMFGQRCTDILNGNPGPSTPIRPRLFNISNANLETLLPSDAREWSEELMNEEGDQKTNDLEHLEEPCAARPSLYMYRHSNLNPDDEPQKSTTHRDGNPPPFFLPFDTTLQPLQRNSSNIASLAGLSSFWRPNKLY